MTPSAAIYGFPPRELADPADDAVQASPLAPGAVALEDFPEAGLREFLVYAPPGVLERRYVLALALRALKPGGVLTALAPKDKGGSRLAKELTAFGAQVDDAARRHHRICTVVRPAVMEGLEGAIAEGAPRQLGPIWTQPGVFSWDRIDPGSALLAEHLPALKGEGADLGCGFGYLARMALKSPAVTRLHLVDIDRRAIDCARRNIDDERAAFHWEDATRAPPLSGLDFVVMNPPFHAAGHEDRRLGQAFLRRASSVLRKGGLLYVVANRHLPYEAVLAEAFARFKVVAEAGGYKVFEAVR